MRWQKPVSAPRFGCCGRGDRLSVSALAFVKWLANGSSVDLNDISVAGVLAVETDEAAKYVALRREPALDDRELEVVNAAERVLVARDE